MPTKPVIDLLVQRFGLPQDQAERYVEMTQSHVGDLTTSEAYKKQLQAMVYGMGKAAAVGGDMKWAGAKALAASDNLGDQAKALTPGTPEFKEQLAADIDNTNADQDLAKLKSDVGQRPPVGEIQMESQYARPVTFDQALAYNQGKPTSVDIIRQIKENEFNNLNANGFQMPPIPAGPAPFSKAAALAYHYKKMGLDQGIDLPMRNGYPDLYPDPDKE